jgi:hypothetical protein
VRAARRSSGARGHGEVRRPYIAPLHREEGAGGAGFWKLLEGFGRWGRRARARAGGRTKASEAAAVPRGRGEARRGYGFRDPARWAPLVSSEMRGGWTKLGP